MAQVSTCVVHIYRYLEFRGTWVSIVFVIRQMINTENVPLLVRDPLTRMYSSTFSRFISETLDVAQLMMYKRHEIPQRLHFMLKHKEMMCQRYMYSDKIVYTYDAIRYRSTDSGVYWLKSKRCTILLLICYDSKENDTRHIS